MTVDLLNFMLAFMEGFALILSPCILPILPILLAGTIAGNRNRPFGIILGFSLTFAVVTFFSRFLVQHAGINLAILRDLSFALIIGFGLIMLSDFLTNKFSLWTQKIANLGTNLLPQQQLQGGFWSGLLLGALVSLIWTPCAGPILAVALIQIATQKTPGASFIALLCFSLGSVLPMLFLALMGKKIMNNINFLKNHTQLLRKFFGAIIIFTTLLLLYVSYYQPDFFAKLVPTTAQNTERPLSVAEQKSTQLINGINPYPAPAIANIAHWINTTSLNLADLKGKVVLIDFWTYSCINCIRTLPYLLAWDKAYKDKGLVIIGVHTPEFEFEKQLTNVQQAVKKFGINYPVALDNQYTTWTNYANHYWPAHYLIDKKGNVVYTHFGEGDDKTTEHNIQVLLGLQPSTLATKKSVHENFIEYSQTPETYLGYARAENFAGPDLVTRDNTANYSFPAHLGIDEWGLQGSWRIEEEKIVSMGNNAAIKIRFNASHVYVVMGNGENPPQTIQVLLNDKPLAVTVSGADSIDSKLLVNSQRLYELVHFPKSTSGEITLIIPSAGIEIYTFTFG